MPYFLKKNSTIYLYLSVITGPPTKRSDPSAQRWAAVERKNNVICEQCWQGGDLHQRAVGDDV